MPHTPPLPSSDRTLATRNDIQRLERRIADLQDAVDKNARDLETQLTRMGQLQADIDLIRAAWARLTPHGDRRRGDRQYSGPERRRAPRKTNG